GDSAETAAEEPAAEGPAAEEPAVEQPAAEQANTREPDTREPDADLGGAIGDGSASGADDGLVAEGDAAGDYLERLLDILDYDGDIDLDVEGERAVVSIVGDGDVERLVGDDGRVLNALQELTRLAAGMETGGRSRLVLDVAGYRARRRE